MQTLDVNDTIVAIASPPGAAERGILRISGPAMANIVDTVFCSAAGPSVAELESTDAFPGHFALDDDLAIPGDLLVWPTSRSYTRQPSAEFHTIGSMPLLQMALKRVCDAGARIAEPGEFTLRAFLSGRLDLTQAEAVLAVIDASGQNDLRSSLQQLAGGMSNPLTQTRDQLIAVLAELEAQLDFAEEDIEFISSAKLLAQLNAALETLKETTDQLRNRSSTDQHPTVALVGLPNAGKSSLFNTLVGQQQAIVTNLAGTTTDYLSADVRFLGIEIRLLDTAGVEELSSNDKIASSAQQQRAAQTWRANVRVLCVPADQHQNDQLEELLADLIANAGGPPSANTIIAITKSDVPNTDWISGLIRRFQGSGLPCVTTSSQDRQGISELASSITATLLHQQSTESPIVGSTLVRTANSLGLAEKSVELAIEAASENLGEELVATEIRQALDELGRVVGTIYSDDILDVVFGQFCIGK